jgi:hypothetical protein
VNNVGLSSLGDLGARRVAVRFSLAGGILAPQALAAFAILVFKIRVSLIIHPPDRRSDRRHRRKSLLERGELTPMERIREV